jgi:hypothetical protein
MTVSLAHSLVVVKHPAKIDIFDCEILDILHKTFHNSIPFDFRDEKSRREGPPLGIPHVGLLFNEPAGAASLLFS